MTLKSLSNFTVTYVPSAGLHVCLVGRAIRIGLDSDDRGPGHRVLRRRGDLAAVSAVRSVSPGPWLIVAGFRGVIPWLVQAALVQRGGAAERPHRSAPSWLPADPSVALIVASHPSLQSRDVPGRQERSSQ
jgi:hypothetical protein